MHFCLGMNDGEGNAPVANMTASEWTRNASFMQGHLGTSEEIQTWRKAQEIVTGAAASPALAVSS